MFPSIAMTYEDEDIGVVRVGKGRVFHQGVRWSHKVTRCGRYADSTLTAGEAIRGGLAPCRRCFSDPLEDWNVAP